MLYNEFIVVCNTNWAVSSGVLVSRTAMESERNYNGGWLQEDVRVLDEELLAFIPTQVHVYRALGQKGWIQHTLCMSTERSWREFTICCFSGAGVDEMSGRRCRWRCLLPQGEIPDAGGGGGDPELCGSATANAFLCM